MKRVFKLLDYVLHTIELGEIYNSEYLIITELGENYNILANFIAKHESLEPS